MTENVDNEDRQAPSRPLGGRVVAALGSGVLRGRRPGAGQAGGGSGDPTALFPVSSLKIEPPEPYHASMALASDRRGQGCI